MSRLGKIQTEKQEIEIKDIVYYEEIGDKLTIFVTDSNSGEDKLHEFIIKDNEKRQAYIKQITDYWKENNAIL
jgi:hypothetical protein